MGLKQWPTMAARHAAAGAGAALCALGAPVAAEAARGFELVTPAGAGQYAAQPIASTGDGAAFYWTATSGGTSDPAPDDGGQKDAFVAQRGGAAWSSSWLTPTPLTTGDTQETIVGLDAIGVDYISNPFAGADAPHLYRGGGSADLLSAAPGDPPGATGLTGLTTQWTAATDLSSAVFTTAEALIAADADALNDVYRRTPSGIALVSTTVSGVNDATADASLAFGASSAAPSGFPANNGATVMSQDGTTIVFSSTAQLDPVEDTDASADLYQWRNGAVSLVSDAAPSTCGATDCDVAVTLEGMTPNGGMIFMSTTERLTGDDADSASDVYRYEAAAAPGQRMKLASGGHPIATRPVSVVSITGDGELFYAGGSSAAPSAVWTIYRWNGTASSTVAVLGNADGNIASSGIARGFGNAAARSARASSDGETFAFLTRAKLDAVADADTAADVYLWTSAGTLTLASGSGSSPVLFGGGRSMSADGSRLTFSSPDALTADAPNNGVAKLYEWVNGAGLTLVSPASPDALAVTYVDSSADGAVIFFATADTIDLADQDGGVSDVYAARVDAFPPTAPSTSGVGASPGAGGGDGGGPPAGPVLPSTSQSTEPPPTGSGGRPSGDGPQDGGSQSSILRLPDRRLTGGVRRLTFAVATSQDGTATLILRKRGRNGAILGRGAGDLQAGDGEQLTIRLTKAGRRARRHGGLRGVLEVRLDPAEGGDEVVRKFRVRIAPPSDGRSVNSNAGDRR